MEMELNLDEMYLTVMESKATYKEIKNLQCYYIRWKKPIIRLLY